jgi:hypothetical protein
MPMAKSSGIKKVSVELVGTAPLMMQNPQMANPLNSWCRALKEVSGKRKKTDDDILTMFEIEFHGSLYHEDVIGPYMPNTWVHAAIQSGAKKHKKGMAGEVLAALDVDETEIPIEYNGPRDRDSLYKDQRFVDVRSVVIKGSRVMRCRPKFPHPWFVKFNLTIMTEVLNTGDVQQCLNKAGIYCGLGTYRPLFGRFVVKKFESC